MAKGSSSLQSRKARSSKPYDASNSFVRKVASQVTNLLPQPDWITRWFSSSSSQQNVAADEDDDDVVEVQPPPNKRAKISLNTALPAENFRVATEAELRARRPVFTSPSPVKHVYSDSTPGPSGLSTSARFSTSATLQSTMISENVESKLNGDGGSDSSESTSGCSSLVPQASKQTSGETLAARRRSIDEKLSLTNHLQRPKSLFPNRVRSPRVLPPPNRRRPSFDLAYFNSTPLLERDKLPPKEVSPFYTGRTMFGGASAYRRHRENSINDELNLSKRGTQIRLFSETKDSSNPNVSITARRIMEALEEFSSPVQDAKRMPRSVPAYRPVLGSKRKCADDDTLQSPATIFLPGTPRRSNLPSQSQTVPLVADLMKVHCRKLQDSMESARRRASVVAEPYSIRQMEDKKNARHQNKILKNNQIELVMPSDVNLPEVPLPITTMPKLDIMVPPATSVATCVSSYSFKFSPPIVVTSVVSNIKAQGIFTFSQPVDKRVVDAKVTQNLNTTCPSLVEAKANLKKKEPKTLGPKSNEHNNSSVCEIKPASELKPGSVMDNFKSQNNEESEGDSGVSVGFGDAFKPAVGSWECGVCMIRNTPDLTSCVACETPREKKTAASTTSSNTWNCKSCFVVNNNSATACIACTVAKPGLGPVKKPTEDSVDSRWNCVACQAVNAASSTVCKDCWCNKPLQTSSETIWTCLSCKNRNNVSEDKCTSCKKSKSSTSPSSKTPSSNIKFNVPIPAEASSFKFGIDKPGLQNASGANLGGFKFGESGSKTDPTVTFSFGVPSSTATQGSDKSKDPSPVITTPCTSVSAKLNASFSFGTNQNQFSEVSNSTAGSVRKVPEQNGADGVGSSGTSSTVKRKSEGADAPTKEVISAQKRKAESSEADKSKENKEKPSGGCSKPGVPVFNSIDALKPATVSSSSLSTTAPVCTKITTNSGFSFVSSSTSIVKPVVTSAPTFVFGGNLPKSEQPSAGQKTASSFSAPATTTTVIPSFSSTVTSSSGFGSTTNVPTTTATFMFGSGNNKSSFGTATTSATTTTNSPSTKASFAASVTTNPSFGVPDTTTPAFGSPAAKPNSTTSSVATTSASITFGSNSSPKPPSIFGGNVATTVPSFSSSSLLTTTAAGSFTSTPASPFAGTITTAASAFGSTSTTPSFGLTPAAKFPNFGTPSTTPSIFGSTTTAVTPSFGSTTTTTASVFGATTTPSIFGSTVTTTASAFGSTIPTTASIFGSTPTTTASVFGSISTPAFGSATTTLTSSFNNTPVTTPSFSNTGSFGTVPPSSTPNFGNPSTTPTPTFGAPVTTASSFVAPSLKPGGFGSTAPTPSFGIPSTNAPTFGTQSTPTFGSSSGNVNFGTPAFGTPVVTTSSVGFGTPTATPSFGAPKTETTFGTPVTASGFGSSFGTTPSSSFGGFSSEAAKGPASGAFVFKGNAAPSIFGGAQNVSNNSEVTPSKVPSFGFGTAAPSTQNTTSAGQAQSFGPFNFSTGSTATPPTFGSNTGGTQGSAGFGSGATPAFGSSSGSFGTGAFNFNAGSSNPQPFAFTGNQPSQNATPSFGQVQQPQPALPTFNPNVRPTFDFTRGETPQFTAQSTTPAIVPPRRVKKAVRRVR